MDAFTEYTDWYWLQQQQADMEKWARQEIERDLRRQQSPRQAEPGQSAQPTEETQ